MSASGYTPIQLYRTSTAAAVPSAGNLASGELAINLTDEKLYFKNASGVVTLLASSGGAVGTVSSVNASGGTTGLTFSGGPITTSGTLTLAGTLGVANGGTGATSLTSGYLVKGNGTSAASASVVYDDGTNVGIGTTTANGILSVVGNQMSVGSAGGSSSLGIQIKGTTLSAIPTAQVQSYIATGNSSMGTAGDLLIAPRTDVAANIRFITGTTPAEQMRITYDGNVGIGTSSPARKLDVNGSIRLGDAQAVEWGGTAYAIVGDNAGAMLFKTASSERMRITSAGNVGIGTTNPVALLAVSNAGAAGFEVNPTGGVGGGATIATYNRGTAAYTSLTTYSSTMTWYAGGTTRAMDLDTSGNLGIGTSSPGNRLTVSGSGDVARFTNSLSSAYIALDSGGYSMFTGAGQTGNGIYANATSNYTALYTASSERMRIDSSGNLGLGVTPSAGSVHIDVSNGASLYGLGTGAQIAGNAAFSSGNWVYRGTGKAARIDLNNGDSGGMLFSVASSSGTAGNAISFTQAMTLNASGNLGIGTSSPGTRLHVQDTETTVRLTATSGRIWDVVSGGGGNVGANFFAIRDTSSGANVVQIAPQASEAMRIDSSGNVGIGTTSMSRLLTVGNGAGAKYATINGGATNAGDGGALLFEPGGTFTHAVGNYSSILGGAYSDSFMLYQKANSPMLFYTNNTERFRITSTGGITSSDLADAVGYKGLPQNSQTATYTLALSDMGKHISITTGGVVIPANASVAFPIGAAISIFNNSGSNQTISITSDTLRQAGTANTGSRTLAQYGIATCVKVGTTTWVISGAGVS